VASHAGTRLLTDLAEVTGLTEAFGEALGDLRMRESGHDPGRVAVDLALMVADGGEAISHLAVLRDQPDLPFTGAAGRQRHLPSLLDRGRRQVQREQVG